MRAISSVNVLGNSIGVEQAQKLINILQAKEALTTLCGFSGDEIELDLSNKNLSAGCAVLVANEISDTGALSALSLRSNNLATKEAGRALAMALATNSVLKELDVSNNLDGFNAAYTQTDGAAFAQELAVGIRDNGALSKLDLSVNRIPATEAGMLDATCKAKGVDLAL
jgi:hypothetical protein